MRDRSIRLATVALVALLASGCSVVVQQIDGVTVGPAYDCAGDGLDCSKVADVALRAFEAREPAHPNVAAWTIYHEDPARMGTRSGTLLVVAVDLVDGTRRLISVYSAPGGLTAMPAPLP